MLQPGFVLFKFKYPYEDTKCDSLVKMSRKYQFFLPKSSIYMRQDNMYIINI